MVVLVQEQATGDFWIPTQRDPHPLGLATAPRPFIPTAGVSGGNLQPKLKQRPWGRDPADHHCYELRAAQPGSGKGNSEGTCWEAHGDFCHHEHIFFDQSYCCFSPYG